MTRWRACRAARRTADRRLDAAVRSFGPRRARYRGLAKVHCQHLASAAALNLGRIVAWQQGQPLAPTL
ncbi:transposase [Azospirillum palustre]